MRCIQLLIFAFLSSCSDKRFLLNMQQLYMLRLLCPVLLLMADQRWIRGL